MAKKKTETETKSIKYTFTKEEKAKLSEELVLSIEAEKLAEAELVEIKQQYKARIETAALKSMSFHQKLRAGFEMRDEECYVKLRPKDREKDWYLAETDELVLTEPMLPADFQPTLV